MNSTTRVPFERDVALVLEELPPGAPILMEESDHIGALQDAGIPLRQTFNESDYDSWHAALEDPAGHAAYVIAFDGDAVAKAVAAHPQGLQELSILCGTGQGCARVYQAEINRKSKAPAAGPFPACAIVLPCWRGQSGHVCHATAQFTMIEQLTLTSAIARLLMACAMGAIVGIERERRHKASDLRTSMLICMGAALNTMLSPVLAGGDWHEQRNRWRRTLYGASVSGCRADPACAQPCAGADQRRIGMGGGGGRDDVRRRAVSGGAIAPGCVCVVAVHRIDGVAG